MATKEFSTLLDSMDLGDIERLRLATEAIQLLEREKSDLERRISEVDDRIAGLRSGSLDPSKVIVSDGGPSRRRRRGGGRAGSRRGGRRPSGAGTLRATMAEVLAEKGGPMSVAEIEAAVLDKGFKSTSDNFAQVVRTTLSRAEEIKRVGRGRYTLKKTRTAKKSG